LADSDRAEKHADERHAAEHGLVEVDEVGFPVVLVRLPVALNKAAIHSMFEGLDRVLRRDARFSLVVDTRALKQFPTAVERNEIGQWMKARTLAEARYNVGNAIVLRSPAVRATLTAIHWIRRPVTDHVYLPDVVEAIDWSVGQLTKGNVPIPPAVAALREAERARAR
jgi:hypothetical protein